MRGCVGCSCGALTELLGGGSRREFRRGKEFIVRESALMMKGSAVRWGRGLLEWSESKGEEMDAHLEELLLSRLRKEVRNVRSTSFVYRNCGIERDCVIVLNMACCIGLRVIGVSV